MSTVGWVWRLVFYQAQVTVDISTSGCGGHTGSDTEIEQFSSEFYVEFCVTARPIVKTPTVCSVWRIHHRPRLISPRARPLVQVGLVDIQIPTEECNENRSISMLDPV